MKGFAYLTPAERMFKIVVYVFTGVFALLCFLPFWMVIVGSFTDESVLRQNVFQLYPRHFTLFSYRYLFSGHQLFNSYKVTVLVTTIGTLLAILITAAYAYVISNPKVKYRNVLAFFTYVTVIFGAGLVGFYLLIANWLGLKDSIWALILPYVMNPFFAFILVSFFRSLPFELNEAATIDGANEIYIFFRIILPISLPVMATISLFYALQYWNDWWLALLFIDDYKLHPLQMMIRQLISNANIQQYISGGASYAQSIPTYGVQLATVCVTIGPIIFLYPFLQKYFVQGLTVGAIKG